MSSKYDDAIGILLIVLPVIAFLAGFWACFFLLVLTERHGGKDESSRLNGN